MTYFEMKKPVFFSEIPKFSVAVRTVFKVVCWERTFPGDALAKKMSHLPETDKEFEKAIE
jgi:hypothetical protein